jgi:hypothetical protein
MLLLGVMKLRLANSAELPSLERCSTYLARASVAIASPIEKIRSGSNVAPQAMFPGKTVDTPFQETPCRASPSQEKEGSPNRGIAGTPSFIH